jgi:peptidyl-prolyl isomerase E (cyclophilin E)
MFRRTRRRTRFLPSTLTTTLAMSKKSNTLIYVGGLDDTVSEEVLHAAFIPFGELKSIQIPKDYKESKSRFNQY